MAAGAGRWWPGGLGLEGAWWRPGQAIGVQVRELETVLEAGPAAWGWDEDQCWTLARIADIRGRPG